MRRAPRSSALVIALAVSLLGVCTPALAQNPVTWSATATSAGQKAGATPATGVKPGGTFTVEVVARVEEGWHIYSVKQPPPPIATKVSVAPDQPFAPGGEVKAPSAEVKFDQSFGIDTEFYEGTVSFTLPVTVAAGAPAGTQPVKVRAYYQACSDTLCLPPKPVNLAVDVTVSQSANTGQSANPSQSANGGQSGRPTPTGEAKPPTGEAKPPTGEAKPPIGEAKPPTGEGKPSTGEAKLPVGEAKPSTGMGGRSLWSFLWLAMSVGALSLLTPCVFPMVPITVSYFTNHAAGSRAKAVRQAATYMVGIILTFTALGMALALLVGATSLNRFAANPWVNLLITAIFVGFALSLLGAFDLQVPPALVNKLDSLTRRQGGSQTLATLLMGLTFTLTSFTCTAPFIGTLLVMAAGGDWAWPLVGMLAFSTVFALPFFVLALMPQWIARLPRSGGWLHSVKVMMAFLEIAAAMKFISNVDLVWGWGIFTRDVVLASWVVIGVLMTLYVMGLFRLQHDAPVAHVGLVRLSTAIVCGTISLWLLTGLFGKRLGEIEAFLPPAPEGMVEAASRVSSAEELPWMTNDYQGALERGAREGKPVFIDFTGYTCTNCRWMEANMFTRPEVQRELRQYVLVRLYTDGDGEIYERQQQLQQAKYQTVALPFYAVVDGGGRPVANFPGLTRDPARFVDFLRGGSAKHAAALPAIDDTQ